MFAGQLPPPSPEKQPSYTGHGYHKTHWVRLWHSRHRRIGYFHFTCIATILSGGAGGNAGGEGVNECPVRVAEVVARSKRGWPARSRPKRVCCEDNIFDGHTAVFGVDNTQLAVAAN